MSSGAAMYMPSLFAAICFCRVPQASCWVGLMLWSTKRIVCSAWSTAWPCVELKAAAVPASVVACAVVAVAVDAVAELGDRLGVLFHLGPGGRRIVRVEPGLRKQRPVDDQALGVVDRRQAVEGLARGHRRHRGGYDVAQVGDSLGVYVGRDVGGLARVEDLVPVGEVGVEDVRLVAGVEHGGERGRHLARVLE